MRRISNAIGRIGLKKEEYLLETQKKEDLLTPDDPTADVDDVELQLVHVLRENGVVEICKRIKQEMDTIWAVQTGFKTLCSVGHFYFSCGEQVFTVSPADGFYESDGLLLALFAVRKFPHQPELLAPVLDAIGIYAKLDSERALSFCAVEDSSELLMNCIRNHSDKPEIIRLALEALGSLILNDEIRLHVASEKLLEELLSSLQRYKGTLSLAKAHLYPLGQIVVLRQMNQYFVEKNGIPAVLHALQLHKDDAQLSWYALALLNALATESYHASIIGRIHGGRAVRMIARAMAKHLDVEEIILEGFQLLECIANVADLHRVINENQVLDLAYRAVDLYKGSHYAHTRLELNQRINTFQKCAIQDGHVYAMHDGVTHGDAVFYTFFLVLVTVYATLNPYGGLVATSTPVVNLLNVPTMVESIPKLYDYLQGTHFRTTLFPATWYNGDALDNTRLVFGSQYLLGQVQLRQIRYNADQQTIFNANAAPFGNWSDGSTTQSNAIQLHGYNIPSGGFLATLPTDPNLASSCSDALCTMQTLRAISWLDNSTMALVIDWNIYNVAYDSAMACQIAFVFDSANDAIYSSTSIKEVQFNPYRGLFLASGLFYIELGLIICTLYSLYMVIAKIRRYRRYYFYISSHLMDFTLVMLWLAMWGSRIHLLALTTYSLSIQLASPRFVSLQDVADIASQQQVLFSCISLLMWLDFPRYLSFSNLRYLLCVINASTAAISAYAVYISVLVLGLAQFRFITTSYSSFWITIVSVFNDFVLLDSSHIADWSQIAYLIFVNVLVGPCAIFALGPHLSSSFGASLRDIEKPIAPPKLSLSRSKRSFKRTMTTFTKDLKAMLEKRQLSIRKHAFAPWEQSDNSYLEPKSTVELKSSPDLFHNLNRLLVEANKQIETQDEAMRELFSRLQQAQNILREYFNLPDTPKSITIPHHIRDLKAIPQSYVHRRQSSTNEARECTIATTHFETMLGPSTRIVPLSPRVIRRQAVAQARSSRWLLHIGRLYIVWSIACSFLYLWVLAPYASNDFWWKGFTTQATQTFLADVFNSQLQLNSTITTPLISSTISELKDYSMGGAVMDISLAYPRQLLLGSPIPFSTVIEALRANDLSKNVKIFTRYCWFDFNKVYSMAFTQTRAQQCLAKKHDNAAVYLESMFRNTNKRELNEGVYAALFSMTMFQYISDHDYLDSILNSPWLPISEEVVYWESNGLKKWQTEVTNYFQQGIHNTIAIVNAFGQVQNITISSIPSQQRSLSIWTMLNAYTGIWNDLDDCQYNNCSLIRDMNSKSNAIQDKWEQFHNTVLSTSPIIDMVHQYIGKFGSLSVTLISKPTPLTQAFANFLSVIHKHISQTNISYLSTTLTAYPRHWNDGESIYYGGNPMCLFASGTSFIQPQFGFYDTCGSPPSPDQISIDITSFLWASWVSGANEGYLRSICLSALLDMHCMNIFAPSFHILQLLPPPPNILSYIEDLNITYIQFAAKRDGSSNMHTQPLVAPDNMWNFFGLIMVHDWLRGAREVFCFEGDIGAVVLMSKANDFIGLPANPLEFPQQSCMYLWAATVYISLVLGNVGLLVLLVQCYSRSNSCAKDLFFFNRVGGFVWLGRPLLLLRAVTAILLLSSTPVNLNVLNNITMFDVAPRSLPEILLIAGEATWISYILVDIFLPFCPVGSHIYAPISSTIAWIAIVVLEMTTPFQALVNIKPTCRILQLGLSIACQAGYVEIGSFNRFVVLLFINISSFICVLLVLTISRRILYRGSVNDKEIQHVLLPASSEAFLHHTKHCYWFLDNTKMVLSGMIPMRSKLFAVNLWLVVSTEHVAYTQRRLQIKPNVPKHQNLISGLWRNAKTIAGIGYIVFTVLGSFSFIYLSENALANDFLWASFNSTGHQTFLMTWFTSQLQHSRTQSNVDLTLPSYADESNLYNHSNTFVYVPALYATRIQDEVNKLTNVINGLRNMDGCLVPWISTYLCFVDFNQTWEMAVTAKRQEMCRASEQMNGAVYLEAYLRNVNWAGINDCWLDSLETGIITFLNTSRAGREWQQATLSVSTSTKTEVDFWLHHNITEFTTNWQSYKTLGVFEIFSIQNAFGFQYPMSIKTSNWSLHAERQTSFKFNFPLASLFWSISSNTTAICGSSLIRQSPNFAFKNMSIERLLMQNHTLASPLGSGMWTLQSVIGPFGSIVAKRKLPPRSLLNWYQKVLGIITKSSTKSNNASISFMAIPASNSGFMTMPAPWRNLVLTGGDITCDVQPPTYQLTAPYTNSGVCQWNLGDDLVPSRNNIVLAVLAVGKINASETCMQTTTDWDPCINIFNAGYLFAVDYITDTDADTIASLKARATSDLYPIQLLQYSKNGNSCNLLQFDLVSHLSDSFGLLSWLYIIEWVQGVREVVRFQGELSEIVTISGRTALLTQTVNSLEVPLNVAYYARCILLYITGVMFLVGAVVISYIISSKGKIEGANMFVINRVAGLVWIGRPLLLLRSITALCLLSTASMNLAQTNGIFFFVVVEDSWYSTVMAAGEITWLVFILNDGLSLITKSHTGLYATKSSVVVWAAAALWCYVHPVQPNTTLDRSCIPTIVDFHAYCFSGTVAIGDYDRFVNLFVLAVVVVVVLYTVQRVRFPNAKAHIHNSFWLYGTAQYHFETKDWIENKIYYIDKASALITGLISLQTNHTIYMLDIKSWRLFALETVDKSQTQFRHVIPLRI